MRRRKKRLLGRVLAATLAGGCLFQSSGCPGAIDPGNFPLIEAQTVFRDILFFAFDTALVKTTR